VNLVRAISTTLEPADHETAEAVTSVISGDVTYAAELLARTTRDQRRALKSRGYALRQADCSSCGARVVMERNAYAGALARAERHGKTLRVVCFECVDDGPMIALVEPTT
jgi:hypothetical protein